MRPRHQALIFAVATAASLVACHSKPNTEASVAPPLAMRAFGDTASYGMQVLSLDRQKEVAKISLRAPAELIVLSVIPGKEIELIVPSDLARSSHASFAKGVSSIQMARFEDSPRPANADSEHQQAMEYNRCLQRAQAGAKAQARRSVKRDSTGKIIDDGRGSDQASEIDAERRAEASCARTDRSFQNRPAPPVRQPPRAPADRYLVVLASSLPLTSAQLGERLSSLTAVGSDVATTIEAIAAGLYAGLPGKWSGGYVAW